MSESLPARPIQLAILEDHPLMRESLLELLEEEGMEVVLASGDAREFSTRAEGVDVAIIDLTLASPLGAPAGDGFTALLALREASPATKILVFSGSTEVEIVERCYQAGVAGYLYKLTAGRDSLINAVRQVLKGERIFPVELLPQVFGTGRPAPSRLDRLTAREREVLACVTAGFDNLKIAAVLNITERTVKSHIASLYRKLDADNRVQLALMARQLGLGPATSA